MSDFTRLYNIVPSNNNNVNILTIIIKYKFVKSQQKEEGKIDILKATF